MLGVAFKSVNISVVVQFYPWFEFYFPLFWGIVIMIMSLKQRKIKFKPRIKKQHSYIDILNVVQIKEIVRSNNRG